MNYWEECIKESFEDAGITATDNQIGTVVCWVEGAHENEGLATGRDCIPNPLSSEIDRLKAAYKKEVGELERAVMCYRNSVAVRRGVPVTSVYLDGDSVIYDRR